MLITDITLNNFRQFKGKKTISFSTDQNKNVTVIIGENGSGKTTLAQAFTWCLYGKTDFKNDSVINLSCSNDMKPGSTITATVKINLVHNNTNYTIKRSQDYQKDNSGKIKHSPAILSIAYKDTNGNQQFVKETQIKSKIKEILPKELSKYFFFDGERIEKMSDQIQSGNSPEFAEAVKSLLGLNTYVAAIRHLGGEKRAGSRNSVIGNYNSSYDSSNNTKISEYTKTIENIQNQIDNLLSRKDDINKEIPLLEKEKDEYTVKIAANKDGEKFQRQCNIKREKINHNNEEIDSSSKKILTAFKKNYKFFFFKKLIGDALDILSRTDEIDKGIPDITDKTIDFLLKREFCICGHKITEGSAEQKALKELLQYIPPASLGTVINMFVKECKFRAENGEDISQVTFDILSEVENKRQENEDLSKEIEDLEERIKSFESIGHYQIQLDKHKEELQKKQRELSAIDMKLGELTTSKERQETERNKLTLQDDANRKITVYKAYAQKIYDILTAEYSKREKEVREKLEQSINDIFLTIYNGGLSLKIDEKYNIKTIINDESSYSGIMDDTSTAQSISIIFAFIAGVIKVARESQSDKSGYDLSAEAYPLVMDAPLSAFDKKRIKSVCETLPNIAEQVIIFIKDTDGEIAEKYLSDKIGASYEFDKKTETETDITRRN